MFCFKEEDEDQDECCYCPCVCPDLYFCGCKIHCMSRGERRHPTALIVPVKSDFNNEQIVTVDQKTFFLVEVNPDDPNHPSQSAIGGSPSFRISPSHNPVGGRPSSRTSPSHILVGGSHSFRTSPSNIPLVGSPNLRASASHRPTDGGPS